MSVSGYSAALAVSCLPIPTPLLLEDLRHDAFIVSAPKQFEVLRCAFSRRASRNCHISAAQRGAR